MCEHVENETTSKYNPSHEYSEIFQYHRDSCWCSGSLRCQINSIHGIDTKQDRRVPVFHETLFPSIEIVIMFSQINSGWKELIINFACISYLGLIPGGMHVGSFVAHRRVQGRVSVTAVCYWWAGNMCYPWTNVHLFKLHAVIDDVLVFLFHLCVFGPHVLKNKRNKKK